MKSRCLLNSCNSTSQFISIMFRCSCFFLVCLFVCLFFYQIKNFLFLMWVNLCMITGIYLHDPPPFNGPFFMTPPFSESKKVVTLPLFPPPTPLLISDKSLIQQLRLPRRIRQNSWLHAARLPFFHLLQWKCTHKNQKVSVQENDCKSRDGQIFSNTDLSVV